MTSSTFGPEDLKLLDALGTNQSTSRWNTRLVNRLEVALAHETEMSKIKDDFVATVSHELRRRHSNASRGPEDGCSAPSTCRWTSIGTSRARGPSHRCDSSG